jgi:hypothetical protein
MLALSVSDSFLLASFRILCLDSVRLLLLDLVLAPRCAYYVTTQHLPLLEQCVRLRLPTIHIHLST